MRNGHYELTLSSHNGGIGVGRVVLSDGKISLRKWSGPIKLNGDYHASSDGQRTLFNVDVDVPPGAILATGKPAPRGLAFEVKFEAPALSNDTTATIDTPVGSVQLYLKRVV
jgi:hypothetical protein